MLIYDNLNRNGAAGIIFIHKKCINDISAITKKGVKNFEAGVSTEDVENKPKVLRFLCLFAQSRIN